MQAPKVLKRLIVTQPCVNVHGQREGVEHELIERRAYRASDVLDGSYDVTIGVYSDLQEARNKLHSLGRKAYGY